MTRKPRSGSLLVTSLSLVAILAVLAVAIARQLSLDVRLTRYRLALGQAKALARGGVYLAMQRLARDDEGPDGNAYDWLGDDWASFPQADPDADPDWWLLPFPAEGHPAQRFSGQLRIRITDEGRRLPLNQADHAQLTRLTGEASLAQVIIDARDEPDAAEDRPGEAPPYFAKNGPFVAPEELGELPGMTPDAYETLRSSTSPCPTATEPLNLNTVTPEVLRAVGLSEGAIELIRRFREGPDGSQAHEQDGIFTEAGLSILQTLKDAQGVDLTGTDDGNLLISAQFGVTSEVFTVTSEVVIERPAARARVEAVIRRANCGDGIPAPCVVAWREL